MTEFLTTSAARLRTTGEEPQPYEALTTVAAILMTVAILYVGREIFVPIAIAVLLSFVLSPLIKLLRRVRVSRKLSVWIVVLTSLLIALAVSAVLARQLSDLAGEAPRYQAVITEKIDRLRESTANSPLLQKATTAIGGIERFMSGTSRLPALKPTAPAQDAAQKDQEPQPRAPIPVEVYQPPPGPVALVQTILGTALSPVLTAAIVAVFVMFILLQREDLRDRFIRLVGSQDLQRTTVAMNEAASRLSRYFLIQVLLNASFGVIVTIGLAIIGVPSPILWGVLSFLMRFVPYIGSFVSAAFPIALAAAVDPGWMMTFETAALFLISEPIMGQVIEPWLYGQNTGISPIAVVVSATFWTWLWGPVGLVLSTPLTVCLVVLGRYVRRFAFLDVIFGDAAPLTPVESFYQRMLAGDASELSEQAREYLKARSLTDYYDEIAMQALLLAQADVRRDTLDEKRQRRVHDTITDVIDDLADHTDETPPEPVKEEEPFAPFQTPTQPERRAGPPLVDVSDKLVTSWRNGAPVVCVPAQGALDEIAATMLAQILSKHGLGAETVPAPVLGRYELPAAENIRILCLSFIDGDINIPRAKYAIRRLRRRVPDALVLACFWTAQGNGVTDATQTVAREAGADACAISLVEAARWCLDRAGDPSHGRSVPQGDQASAPRQVAAVAT